MLQKIASNYLEKEAISLGGIGKVIKAGAGYIGKGAKNFGNKYLDLLDAHPLSVGVPSILGSSFALMAGFSALPPVQRALQKEQERRNKLDALLDMQYNRYYGKPQNKTGWNHEAIKKYIEGNIPKGNLGVNPLPVQQKRIKELRDAGII